MSDVSSTVAKGDIIRIELEGRTEDTNEVFDTTSASVAQEAGIFNEKAEYGPITLLVGGGRTFPGLDEALVGSEVGKEYDIVIPVEKAAGERDPKLVDTLPLKEFLKQDIEPRVGMEVSIRNRKGIVTLVTPGRVRVDYNRPLAGKALKYKYTVVSKIDDDAEKVKGVIAMDYGASVGFDVTVEDKVITVILPDVCKYDSNWLMAKYRVVADLREALDARNVRFVEEYVKADAPAPAPVEEPAPEELSEEEIPPQ